MKKILLSACMLTFMYTVKAQDFSASLASAKNNYSKGKLAEARFDMQQMMQQINEKAGLEVLKLYPAELTTFKATDNGEVSGAGGSLGVNIFRTYKAGDKTLELTTITNSPLVPSINAMFGISSLVGGSDQKTLKVSGYKALLQKNSELGGSSYQLQIPMGNTLMTLSGTGLTEAEIIAAAQKLPLDNIASLLQ